MSRVETGPLKFEDDWTGTFIRGDDSLGFAFAIRSIIEDIEEGREPNPIELIYLKQLMHLLEACAE